MSEKVTEHFDHLSFSFPRTVPESCYPFANQDGYGDSFEEEEEDESANRVASDPASGCRVARTHQADMVRAMAGSCPQLVKRKQLFRTQPAYRWGDP